MTYPSNTDLAIFSQSSLIQEINQIKAQIDAMRPIPKEREAQIMQKLRLDWNYNSNAIEGNSLDYGETVGFLMNGLTAKGKPLKDHLDIKGHNDAINFLQQLIDAEQDISETDIRSLHKIILIEPYQSPAQTMDGQSVHKTIQLGVYKSSPNHVQTITGEIHYYATPDETPILMRELIDWYRSVKDNGEIHPVVIAAIFHHRFAAIHPFDDGNGRMARLMMNLILMKAYYPPVVIKKERKDQYYFALSQADAGNDDSFIKYIAEELLNTVQLYLKGARGERIEEASDLDKKLALFKKEVQSRIDKIEIKRSQELKEKIITENFSKLLTESKLNMMKFKDLFLHVENYWVYFNEKWIYLSTEKDEFGKSFMSDETNSLIFCIQFNEFVTESNNFSMELKIVIVFNELDYKIYYRISPVNELGNYFKASMIQWLENPYISKYYHQELEETDYKSFSQEIGNRVFEYIQLIYNDFSAFDLTITTERLLEEWASLPSRTILSVDLITLVSNVRNITRTSNQISVYIPNLRLGDMYGKAVILEKEFRDHLLRNGLIKDTSLVSIMFN
ncbi:Fic family protein [Fibrella forsythiae]|uniref:Fic family protein n=1 Tax=Fibrella forsythiae TaxID=2817061 RepID=A0ABS3JAF8_9BACT|nr:Fic family protein [Fibrella forsythiae]MBO0946983.1 Fic family protein [Fibrella forsythiae]